MLYIIFILIIVFLISKTIIKIRSKEQIINTIEKAKEIEEKTKELEEKEKYLKNKSIELDQKKTEILKKELEKRENELKEKENELKKKENEIILKAKEQEEKRAKEIAERKVLEIAEKRAKEIAEKRAKEIAERNALEIAEKKAQEIAEKKAHEIAERKALEIAERKALVIAERRAFEIAEKRAKEIAEKRAKVIAENRAKEIADRKALEIAEKRAKEIADNRTRERFEVKKWIKMIEKLTNRKELESYVLTLDKNNIKAIEFLAEKIDNGPAISDLEKHWMIFLWISKNIIYDSISHKSGNISKNSAEDVFKYGLAVCTGFSNLYSAICKLIGLECYKINGFAKGESYKIGDTDDIGRHAWNVIFLEGQFYNIDATLSCLNDNLNKIENEWIPYWFMTPSKIFSESHFSPEMNREITKEEFDKMPYFEFFYHIYGFHCDQIKSSIIYATTNPISLEFTSFEEYKLSLNLHDFVTEKNLNDSVNVQKDSEHSYFKYCIIINRKSKNQKYKLDIFASKIKSESNKEENKFIGRFIIESADQKIITTKTELEKYIPAYNLTYMDNKIKLISHKREFIYLDTDKFVMEFEVDKSVELYFEIEIFETKQIIKDTFIVHKENFFNFQKYFLMISLPMEKKEFVLKLFAKSLFQIEFNHVTEFKLKFEEKPKIINWKEIEKLISKNLISNLTFLNNRIKILSHNTNFILFDSPYLELEFKAEKEIEIVAVLKKANDMKVIHDSTLVQRDPENLNLRVYVTCPEARESFNLCLYSKDSLFFEFAKFRIIKTDFKRQFSFLKIHRPEDSFFVYNQIGLSLKIGIRYKFKYYIEKAKVVFLEQNEHRTYFDESENEPNIFKIEYQPKDVGDLHLCTKYEYGIKRNILCSLAASIPFILSAHKVSYSDQGTFSFVSWPFSLKLLWAPLVDWVFIQRIGRRKSWLIPVQLLMGLFMLLTANYAQKLVYNLETKNDIIYLTLIFVVFITLAATQDIALDGWAISMLSKENVTWQSVCNGVGQTAGVFLSNLTFILFESADFCNKYIRPLFNLPLNEQEGIISLKLFMYIIGILFISSSIFIIFKKEKDYLDVSTYESKLGLVDSYKIMWKLLSKKSIQKFIIIFLTYRIGLACENVANLKLINEHGVSREIIRLITIPTAPFTIILPFFIGKMAQRKPLIKIMRILPIKIVFGLIVALLVYFTPKLKNENHEYDYKFYLIYLSLSFSLQLIETSLFTCQMAYCASIADALIGGTYMTFLASIINLAFMAPSTLALYLINLLTFKSCVQDGFENSFNNVTINFQANKCSSTIDIKECKEMGGKCITDFDAYYYLVLGFSFLGFMWLIVFRRLYLSLASLPKSKWEIKR
ncbi:unnamed protein product [Brachionus calyciflorus]|uniref:Transglutaminase-like domain-containing protein n=1 Tax=Brachionus calyciflorus TaxID=104777 RepID=A0A814G1K2_9BILA|nr:unnamed protein product [Brachionus calyciflorus]